MFTLSMFCGYAVEVRELEHERLTATNCNCSCEK
jgi:hypothetical protein